MKIIKAGLLLTVLAILSSPALASHHVKTVIDIHVNGMVCDFCAQSVWKVFNEYEEVENVNIDLATGMVKVTLKPGTDLAQEELDKAITYAGYELVDIKKSEIPSQ